MKHLFILFLAISITGSAFAADTPNPSLTVHLLDYLAKDYAGAVQNNKVVSQFEYDEQVEFAKLVSENVNQIPELKGNAEFLAKVESLRKKINDKASAEEVSKLARELQASAISLAKISVAPQSFPIISEGKKIFATSCASCHGNTGAGDGPAGKGLDPAPANFLDPEGKLASSPYQFFNTIRLGVPGTGMVAFPKLSDQEVWALAFYLKSLGFENPKVKSQPKLSLSEIAGLKDDEILKKLEGSEAEKKQALIVIRTFEPSENQTSSFLAIAKSFINESIAEAKKNNFQKAKELSLKAYLEGIEPLEPKIKANRAGLVEKIESQMIQYRAQLGESKLQESEAEHAKVLATISEIEDTIQTKEMSPQMAFSAAFAILLREGFEAVLIIITLLGALKAFQIVGAAKWVHAGWIAALGAGVLAWIFSGIVLTMSGATREVTEGVISLIAVGVLLYVGFWMHRQTEVHRWTKFVKDNLHAAVENKKLFLLAVLSFIAVFREAIEVVLFLRAIWNDVTVTGHNAILLGIAVALVLIFGFSVYAVRFSQRIPIKKLFSISALIMAALSVVLTGKGIHSLQEAGIVSARSLPFDLRIDLLGIYPSLEAIASQLLVIGVLVILWRIDSEPNSNKEAA